MKNFAMRHGMVLSWVILWGSIILASVAATIYDNDWFFLLYIPAILEFFGWIIFDQRWICVCPSCGEKVLNKTESYCPKCGKPTLIRRKLRKICPNGHKIDDEFDRYKNCPKCGKPLQPIETN